MKKKVILSAGGTGGHLFPAQAVADSLKSEADILFVGGKLGKSPYFDRKKYPFEEIETSSLPLKSPWRLFKAIYKIGKGFFQSRKILERFAPDVVVGFGSFFTFPLLLAALSKKIPIILHEQNSIPGKVNRLFSKRALFTAITFSSSKNYLRGKTVEVDFPMRFPTNRKEKKVSLDYFGLKSDKMTLLAFGGSQGGYGINTMMKEIAPFLNDNIQILHFTGKKEALAECIALYERHKLTFCVKEFEPHMDLAWNVADLALTRAGASTITEALNWHVPSILIPFPFAAENHQEKNALHFVNEAKGGWMFIESKVQGKTLKEAIDKAFSGEITVLRKNIERYKKETKREIFHELILNYGKA